MVLMTLSFSFWCTIYGQYGSTFWWVSPFPVYKVIERALLPIKSTDWCCVQKPKRKKNRRRCFDFPKLSQIKIGRHGHFFARAAKSDFSCNICFSQCLFNAILMSFCSKDTFLMNSIFKTIENYRKSLIQYCKIGEKCQNWKLQVRQFWAIFKHSDHNWKKDST